MLCNLRHGYLSEKINAEDKVVSLKLKSKARRSNGPMPGDVIPFKK